MPPASDGRIISGDATGDPGAGDGGGSDGATGDADAAGPCLQAPFPGATCPAAGEVCPFQDCGCGVIATCTCRTAGTWTCEPCPIVSCPDGGGDDADAADSADGPGDGGGEELPDSADSCPDEVIRDGEPCQVSDILTCTGIGDCCGEPGETACTCVSGAWFCEPCGACVDLPDFGSELPVDVADAADTADTADTAPDPGPDSDGTGADAGLPEGSCTMEKSCDGFTSCMAPDAPPLCGICQDPVSAGETVCTDHSTCKALGATLVCGNRPDECMFCGGESICIEGCQSDAGCPEGQSCGVDWACAATSCGSAGDCPADFDCAGGACARRTCLSSSQCAGHCVNSRCFSTPGACIMPPP